jgi:2-keto-3-deoxy-L-rhamnonate aldolase RhmA
MSAAYANHAKAQLAAGRLAIGMVLRQARTVDIAAIARTCGFDWFSIDMEHGAFDVDIEAQIVAAALPVGITPIVRVPGPEPYHFSRLLDAGAQGVIVPHVDDADAARKAVAHCKYPPLGERSIAGVLPQLRFQNMPGRQATESVNDETLLAVMLESRAGLDNAAAIAAVPGVDILLIGINDLCEALGVPGDFGAPAVAEALAHVVAACRSAGVHAGMSGVHDPVLAKKYVGMGMRFIGGGTDQSFLIAGARQRAGFLRSLED